MTISKKEKVKQSSAMNLIERLKDVPKDTKLYSPMFGDVFLVLVLGDSISVHHGNPNYIHVFNKEGKYSEHGECMLFPSKDNRDWNTFNKFSTITLKPFDKVLCRDSNNEKWKCDMFSHIFEEYNKLKFRCIGTYWLNCIPYNDETKHLVGTTEDCPEYYKTWQL